MPRMTFRHREDGIVERRMIADRADIEDVDWFGAEHQSVCLTCREAVQLPIRPNMLEELIRYKALGRLPCTFLQAVLMNNLKEAVEAADHYNQWTIPAIVAWCYNNLPSHIWGSPERVKAWLTERKPE